MSAIREALGMIATPSERMGLLDLADDDLENWSPTAPKRAESLQLWVEAIRAFDWGDIGAARAALNRLIQISGEDDGDTSSIEEAIANVEMVRLARDGA